MRRTKTTRTLLAVTLAALGAVAVAAPALAKPAADTFAAMPAVTPWKAVAASGPVHARTATTAATQALWRPVARGDELMPQTTVETGRQGRVTLTRSASLLIVDPDSRVELPDGGYGEMETSIVQTQGSVLYKVDSRSNPYFEVITPYLVAGVKGTSFLVTVNDRYAAVSVQHGRVQITNPGTGETVLLGPGESVLRHRDELEMDLVRAGQRSGDARKESKRLARMERGAAREGKARAKLERDRSRDAESGTDLSSAQADEEKVSLVTDTDDTDLLSDTEKDALRIEIDDITKELIEDMIREGINDGAIADPIDDDVGVVPPDDDSSTRSSDSVKGPVMIEQQ
jgi:hypothetical protein